MGPLLLMARGKVNLMNKQSLWQKSDCILEVILSWCASGQLDIKNKEKFRVILKLNIIVYL